jgi:hypothetical protein
MPEITLDKHHTALLIADYYADAMGALPHAVSRHCIEKTQVLRDRVREAGILVCYSATVFREGFIEIHDRK